ncbi:MAG TPA: adventurous gliding motility TPR repeat lipoprotein GltE [Anaeromyxobacter sp.]|nr:adventurous gliding motility TPR repeat lipoprotein GltE [Anaeromyxobacter sp.]
MTTRATFPLLPSGRQAILALAAALAGCAGAPARPPASPAPGAPAGRGAAQASAQASAPAARAPAEKPADAGDGPQVSARVQRLFEEAVKAEEEQRKLKVPADWPYLERRWRAVLDEGDVAEAHFNLGVTLEAQGKLGEARAAYERARASKPSLRQAAVNLGVLLEKQGDGSAAAAVYLQAARDFPEDAVSRERLAALYRASGQIDDAWRVAKEALVRDPQSATANKVLAQVAFQRNQLDHAKLVALRAQKLAPADPEIPYLSGQIAAKQGDDAAAAVQLRKALALADGFLPARYALLEAATRKGAWGAVADQAAAILKARPDDARLHLVQAVALRHLGKADEALAALARAEKLAGDRLPEVRLARGVLYARVKSECEPALAELKAYQRAVPVTQNAAQISKLMADCEQMLEENRKALEAAKQMQAEAQRQAAEKAAKEKAAPDAKSAPEGSAAPTSAPPVPREPGR